MRKRIEEWYRGPWMAPPPNDPNSPIVFISAGSNEPHWTARAARALVGFWLAHWQFIIGTVLTVTGLLIACKSSARDRAVRTAVRASRRSHVPDRRPALITPCSASAPRAFGKT